MDTPSFQRLSASLYQHLSGTSTQMHTFGFGTDTQFPGTALVVLMFHTAFGCVPV
jgi:hypothetical protein